MAYDVSCPSAASGSRGAGPALRLLHSDSGSKRGRFSFLVKHLPTQSLSADARAGTYTLRSPDMSKELAHLLAFYGHLFLLPFIPMLSPDHLTEHSRRVFGDPFPLCRPLAAWDFTNRCCSVDFLFLLLKVPEFTTVKITLL